MRSKPLFSLQPGSIHAKENLRRNLEGAHNISLSDESYENQLLAYAFCAYPSLSLSFHAVILRPLKSTCRVAPFHQSDLRSHPDNADMRKQCAGKQRRPHFAEDRSVRSRANRKETQNPQRSGLFWQRHESRACECHGLARRDFGQGLAAKGCARFIDRQNAF